MDALLQCNIRLHRTALEQYARHVDHVTCHFGNGLTTLHRQLAHGVVGRIFVQPTRLHEYALGLVDQFAIRQLP